MALKMKPIKIDESKKKEFAEGLAKQEIQRGTPLTYDPNYPVFRPPYGGIALVYVPNHVVETEEGRQLRMDVSYVHRVSRNGRFEKVRCVNGLGSLGYEHCPLDGVVSRCFDLANLQSEHEMRLKNVNPDEKSEARSAILRNNYGSMLVQNREVNYTFPIVVLETQGEKNTPVVDVEEKSLKYSVEWVVLSENQFNKWQEALKEVNSELSADEELETIGGNFWVMNYSSGIKEGMSEQAIRMTAARNMSIRQYGILGKLAKKLTEMDISLDELIKKWDRETVEWDQSKSAETVVQNALYAPEDLETYSEELSNIVEMQMLNFNNTATEDTETLEGTVSIESAKETPLGILPEGSIDLD